MFGAALGDIVGSKYEFMPIKSKDFVFLDDGMDYTDDTIMTVAVAEALIDSDISKEEETKNNLIASMRKWGRRYPILLEPMALCSLLGSALRLLSHIIAGEMDQQCESAPPAGSMIQ